MLLVNAYLVSYVTIYVQSRLPTHAGPRKRDAFVMKAEVMQRAL